MTSTMPRIFVIEMTEMMRMMIDDLGEKFDTSILHSVKSQFSV